MKIGVTVKGCDAMAFYELAKRKQINLDNVVMIGVNCGGSVSPVLARRMIADKYESTPTRSTRKRSTRASSSSSTKADTRVSPLTNSKSTGTAAGPTAAAAR